MNFNVKTRFLLAGSATVLALAGILAQPLFAQETDGGPRVRGMPGQVQGQRPGAGRGMLPPRAERAGPRAANRAAMVECMGDMRDMQEMRAGRPAPGAQRGSMQARFDTLDTNDDGYLDQNELLAGPSNRIEGLFARLDANADGLLSREELDAARDLQIERREQLRSCMEAQREGASAAGE